jgi:hypothetical protein
LDLGFGIATQMVQDKNAVIGSRKNKTIWDYPKLNNILLKINSKLDGLNSVLEVQYVFNS